MNCRRSLRVHERGAVAADAEAGRSNSDRSAPISSQGNTRRMPPERTRTDLGTRRSARLTKVSLPRSNVTGSSSARDVSQSAAPTTSEGASCPPQQRREGETREQSGVGTSEIPRISVFADEVAANLESTPVPETGASSARTPAGQAFPERCPESDDLSPGRQNVQ